MLILVIMLGILWWIAGLILMDAKIEKVTISKPQKVIILNRYYFFGTYSKDSVVSLDLVTGISAIKKGYSDDSHYVLVI